MAVTFSTTGLVADFARVARLAGIDVLTRDIIVEECHAPHTPPTKLPDGMQAVYVFLHTGRCLKVGKAGPSSAGRYCNHHYGVNRAPSTLAKSLVAFQASLGLSDLDQSNVGAWIREHTDRVNLLLPARYGALTLSLFEVFAQCRLQPMLEGFASQRQMPKQAPTVMSVPGSS